jgi:hypothetical protein
VSVLWPRLLRPVAVAALSSIVTEGSATAATQHPEQTFAPLGGRRVTAPEIQKLIDLATDTAASYGYPSAANDDQRIGFDRAMASVVRASMDVSWTEAGSRDVWSFVSIVVLPHLTMWRFGTRNVERWIATDLTRHTWARLWWQAVVFEQDPRLLPLLGESDLNQLLERRSIGGDPRLVCAIARAVLERVDAGADRRTLFRDVTARLRRRLAFIDPRSLSDEQMLWMCRTFTAESIRE